MSKLYTRSMECVATHLSLPEDKKNILLQAVASITSETEYLGEISLVPITASSAKTIRVIPDQPTFRKLASKGRTEDWFDLPTGETFHVCTYSVRDEDAVRVAIYCKDLTLDFAVNVSDSETYAKRCMNSPKVSEDFQVEIPVTSGESWMLYGYHTENSDVNRYLVRYNQNDITEAVPATAINEVKTHAVAYVERTGVFGDSAN